MFCKRLSNIKQSVNSLLHVSTVQANISTTLCQALGRPGTSKWESERGDGCSFTDVPVCRPVGHPVQANQKEPCTHHHLTSLSEPWLMHWHFLRRRWWRAKHSNGWEAPGRSLFRFNPQTLGRSPTVNRASRSEVWGASELSKPCGLPILGSWWPSSCWPRLAARVSTTWKSENL